MFLRKSIMEVKMTNVKAELEELKKRVTALEAQGKKESGPHVNIGDGLLAYEGKFTSNDRSIGSVFGNNHIKIASLFESEPEDVAKIMDAFSAPERIMIIQNLMNMHLTAKQLMQILKFKTTGKLYHHLSFLEKLGFIEKRSDKYGIKGYYISSIVLIFAGALEIKKQ